MCFPTHFWSSTSPKGNISPQASVMETRSDSPGGWAAGRAFQSAGEDAVGWEAAADAELNHHGCLELEGTRWVGHVFYFIFFFKRAILLVALCTVFFKWIFFCSAGYPLYVVLPVWHFCVVQLQCTTIEGSKNCPSSPRNRGYSISASGWRRGSCRWVGPK